MLVIEDSGVVRMLLEDIIRSDPRLELAASAASAEEGLKALKRTAPDVVSLDIRLPGMDGFEATRRIMAERPTPIVVVSASVEKEDLKIAMNALKAGALSIVEKPRGETHDDYRRMAEALCTQLALMSSVKVVRQRRSARPAISLTRAPRAAEGGPFRILGLAASTGGPCALAKLLAGLPADFPLPILLVQHILGGFLEGFASWLGQIGPLRVAFAKDGEPPAPGTIYLAPAELHLAFGSGRLRLGEGPAISSQRPSGTVLFESLARESGPRALGVLLTGMGDDGASGLLELRRSGGYTIAEHESTAVVYGMPRVAAELGAACELLPIEDIAPRLLELAVLGEPAREAP